MSTPGGSGPSEVGCPLSSRSFSSHYCPNPHTDAGLETADKHLNYATGTLRPQHVRSMLENKRGVTQLQRLAYQPQPIPTAAQGFEPSALLEVFDWSVLWLDNDACRFLIASQFSDWQVFRKHLEHIGIHFLTVLDIAAYLPLSSHPATVTATLDAINSLLKHFESCKYEFWCATHTDDLFQNRRNRCRLLAFIQRAIFTKLVSRVRPWRSTTPT
jgi:hypothetical protein